MPAPELGLLPMFSRGHLIAQPGKYSRDGAGMLKHNDTLLVQLAHQQWCDTARSLPTSQLNVKAESASSHQLGIGPRASYRWKETSRSVQSNCPTQTNTSFEVKIKLLGALPSWVMNILIEISRLSQGELYNIVFETPSSQWISFYQQSYPRGEELPRHRCTAALQCGLHTFKPQQEPKVCNTLLRPGQETT